MSRKKVTPIRVKKESAGVAPAESAGVFDAQEDFQEAVNVAPLPRSATCRHCQSWRISNRLGGPWVGTCILWKSTTKESDTCKDFKEVTSE